MEIDHKLRSLISRTLGLSDDEISMRLSAGDIDAWDSLGHLKLIMNIEEGFKVKFKTERIPHLGTVEKIQKELEAYGALGDGR